MNGGPLAPPADPPVQSVGRYALVAELGRGGTSNVFLAVAQGEPGARPVVLKVLRAYDEDRELRGMFTNEGQLALRLQHPNVVRTFETGREGRQAFLVMEHLEGRPLTKLLGPAGDVPLPLALLVLADALEGLHYAHELRDPEGNSYNIVHRDVSPHNVFVTYEGEVKVLDFGAAKFADATAATAVGAIKGRLRYMAPEQAAGRLLDRRADVFSMGIVLWQAMTGRPLWGDLDDATVVSRLLRGDIPSPGPARADITPNLLAICRRALSPEPARRFETAATFAATLRAELKRHGERGSRDALRAYLGSRFAAEKERAERVVDMRLRQLSTAAAPSAGASDPHTAATPSAGASDPHAAAMPSAGVSDPHPAAAPSAGASGPHPAATPSAGTAFPTPPPTPAPRRRDLALTVLPAAGIALLALLLLVRPHRTDDPDRPAPPPPSLASPSTPSAATPGPLSGVPGAPAPRAGAADVTTAPDDAPTAATPAAGATSVVTEGAPRPRAATAAPPARRDGAPGVAPTTPPAAPSANAAPSASAPAAPPARPEAP
ncbi:MAG TPA: protein kinase [Polyangiaceae bacterium]|nr:protein kinase [Polyangiaceae bacterium]